MTDHPTTNSLLSDNLRKEDLSLAYLIALAAQSGYICEPGPRQDRLSVDATIYIEDHLATRFDVQLKATSSPKFNRDGSLRYRLKRKNYNDLVAPRTVPLYLLVLELPSDEADWLRCTVESLTLKKCFWWTSLRGSDSIKTATKTIIIPCSRRLGPSGLEPILEDLKGGAP